MSTKKVLPWFRMYTDFLNDPKMISMAFEDQRHFIAILALKAGGIVDQECAPELLDRIVAQRIWIDYAIVRDVKKRLVAAGLIDESWQPRGWEKRQMRSDSSTERVRAHREKTKQERNDDETEGDRFSNDDETLQERSSNALDKNREEEIREEEKKDTTHTRKRGADVSTGSPDGNEKPLTVAALVAEEVEQQHARDWLTLRKAKRLPLTPTAWLNVKAEAAQCGMTPAQAVKRAVEEGWAGFRAKWITAPAARDSPTVVRSERNDRSAAAAAIFPRQSFQSEVIDV